MLLLKEPKQFYRYYLHQHSVAEQGTLKRISQTIRLLQQQYKRRHGIHPLPSAWLINELVANASKPYILEEQNPYTRVQLTLKQIIRDTEHNDCMYKNSRKHLPLFPNNQLLLAEDIHLMMKTLLRYSHSLK